MLDPLLLKNDLDSLRDNLKRRNLDVDLEQLIELDESRRKLRFEAEKLRANQKSLGKDIANAEPKEKDVLLEKAAQISENVKKLFDEVEEKDKVFYDLWVKIPNLISSTTSGIIDSRTIKLMIEKVPVKNKNTDKNWIISLLPAAGAKPILYKA